MKGGALVAAKGKGGALVAAKVLQGRNMEGRACTERENLTGEGKSVKGLTEVLDDDLGRSGVAGAERSDEVDEAGRGWGLRRWRRYSAAQVD